MGVSAVSVDYKMTLTFAGKLYSYLTPEWTEF